MALARACPSRVGRDVPGGLDLLHFPVTVPIPAADVPTVTTVFDVQHLEMPELLSPFERRYRGWAYDAAARRSNWVVTCSEHSRRGLVERVGVDPERIS